MLKKTLLVVLLLALGTQVGMYFAGAPEAPEVAESIQEVASTEGDVEVGEGVVIDVEDSTTILLLPLDSRPANTYSPEMVAKASGLDLVMPDSEMLDYYRKPGDIEKYPAWLLESEADYYIVSISQLCYGGLVASRTGDVPLEIAKANLESLRTLKEKIGDKPIYAFDTIQRLAITTSDARSSQYYSATHEWAILKDEVENLGQTDKQAKLDQLESFIPEDIRNDYLAARARNHVINSLAIDLVQEGVIDYLILAQDDASLTGLHRAEREVLKAKVDELGLEDKVMIFPGADEVGVILVSRAVTHHYGLEPTFKVFYSGVEGSRWVAPFEDVNFAANIARHLEAVGARIAENGLIDLFVVTPGGNDSFSAGKVKDLMEQGRRVVICDVVVTNSAHPGFFEAMTDQVEVAKLTGFAGWNTAGNTLGLAIGQAVSSLARDKLEGEELENATKAHFEYLLHRLAKDYFYKVQVQGEIERFTRSNGIDTINIPENLFGFVQEELGFLLRPRLNDFYRKHFAGRSVGDYRLGDAVDWDIKLAWPRFFEIQIIPEISLAIVREE